jgi:tetratricopeptide (TPR) repeat protein
VENLPLLIVCSLRPEQESPAWTLKQLAESDYAQDYLEINIKPLSAGESHTLAGNLLNVPTLPEQVAIIIWQKSQGIPLFIEEMARELLASGAVIPGEDGESSHFAKNIDDINIPESVEALLLARIDRLDDPTRSTVQLAAVIGKTFESPVLSAISENNDQLDQQLLRLQTMGMIEVAEQPVEQAAGQVYMFRHALTQEAAYNTILLRERKRIHGRIGQVIKRLFSERQEEFAPRLAYHFDQAGDHTQAISYYRMAAERAARYYANREAIAHYTSAITIAQETHLKDPALVELYRGRGLVQERLGDFEYARADLERALELAQVAGDAHTEWRCLLDLGKLWSSRDYNQTGDYFRKALELAREMDDPAALARSLNRLGNWYVNSVQPQEGIRLHREALALFEWMDDKPGLAATLDLLGMACQIDGDIVVGANYYKQAIALFRELDDRPGLAASLATLGVSGMNFDTQTLVPAADLTESLYFNNEGLQLAREIGWRAGESFALWIRGEAYGVLGDFEHALASAREALQIAVDIDHHQWMAGSHTTLGHLYLELLAPDKARDHLEQALELAKKVRSGYFTHLATGSLAKCLIMLGEHEEAKTYLDRLVPMDAPNSTIGQRHCWLARAQLFLAQDNPAEALRIIDDLIDTAANLSPGVVITSLWKWRGDSLLALGQTQEAEAVLQAAAENARDSRERTMLWPIQQSLCRLYLATDRPQLADRDFAAAQSVIDALAATIPEQDLKENFRQKASFFGKLG